MSIIQVNHQALRSAAKAIEEYCDVQDKEMKQIDSSVKQMLRNDWIGPDAMEFGGKWEGVDSENSVSKDPVKRRGSKRRISATVRTPLIAETFLPNRFAMG